MPSARPGATPRKAATGKRLAVTPMTPPSLPSPVRPRVAASTMSKSGFVCALGWKTEVRFWPSQLGRLSSSLKPVPVPCDFPCCAAATAAAAIAPAEVPPTFLKS